MNYLFVNLKRGFAIGYKELVLNFQTTTPISFGGDKFYELWVWEIKTGYMCTWSKVRH